MKKDSVDIFCAVSRGEIGKVKSWLIPSLAKQLNIGKINLTLINFTGKGSVYDGESEVGKVSIKEIRGNRQFGFGESHNFAFKTVKPKNYFLIINPDCSLHQKCIENLIFQMESDAKVGIVEGRQLPFEHPKEYDTKTCETPWASGACILIRSSIFEKVKGFDEHFWMYVEDVDFSWRVWLEDYKVVYCPLAVVYHYTGIYFGYNGTRYNIEHLWSARNFIYIMYKYWGRRGEKKAIKLFRRAGYPDYFCKQVFQEYGELKHSLGNDNFRLLRIKAKNKRLSLVAISHFETVKRLTIRLRRKFIPIKIRKFFQLFLNILLKQMGGNSSLKKIKVLKYGQYHTLKEKNNG
ncbi:hypothetical protein COY62_01440 [bacterium (Candidatus Howlettbacteria) CG_4_10_14_0_8_um_filter_40_9]|nr:MAG: hypothetical protein COY62_01440 [bacterium (Candidatus Howlettbacteria) CG_4_10_14_0_8_um_filter_40_9]